MPSLPNFSQNFLLYLSTHSQALGVSEKGKLESMLSSWTVQESYKWMRARTLPDTSQMNVVINKALMLLTKHSCLWFLYSGSMFLAANQRQVYSFISSPCLTWNCSLGQGSPTSRIYCLMIWNGGDVIMTEIKCAADGVLLQTSFEDRDELLVHWLVVNWWLHDKFV